MTAHSHRAARLALDTRKWATRRHLWDRDLWCFIFWRRAGPLRIDRCRLAQMTPSAPESSSAARWLAREKMSKRETYVYNWILVVKDGFLVNVMENISELLWQFHIQVFASIRLLVAIFIAVVLYKESENLLPELFDLFFIKFFKHFNVQLPLFFFRNCLVLLYLKLCSLWIKFLIFKLALPFLLC